MDGWRSRSSPKFASTGWFLARFVIIETRVGGIAHLLIFKVKDVGADGLCTVALFRSAVPQLEAIRLETVWAHAGAAGRRHTR